jgi:hypothetical protein
VAAIAVTAPHGTFLRYVMTARRKPAAFIAVLVMPMFTIGTGKHARKTAQDCINPSFPAQNHTPALIRASARAAHHHCFCLSRRPKRRMTTSSASSARFKRP